MLRRNKFVLFGLYLHAFIFSTNTYDPYVTLFRRQWNQQTGLTRANENQCVQHATGEAGKTAREAERE